MKKNLKTLLGLAGVFIVFAAMLVIPKLVENGSPRACFEGENCLHEEYVGLLVAMIPLLIAIGSVLGAAALYLFYESKGGGGFADAALSLMEKDERAIVGRIAGEGGRITQSEISRIAGIGKVKAHRMLLRLEKRGVIEREQYGKTNMVKLSGKYSRLFFGGEK